MKFNELITGMANKTNLKVRKASPEIFVVAGVVGVVVSTIMACKASRHVDDVLEEHNEKLEEIKDNVPEDDPERKKEITKTYAKTGIEFAKLYWKPALLGTLSIGLIFQSHNILRKRNIALAAAYKSIDAGFKKYRERVISELGDAADRKFKFGVEEEKAEVTEVDKNGKEKTKEKKVEVVDADFSDASPYSRIFDEFSTKWQDDPEYNRMFLTTTEQYANDYLRAHGYLFLNQVYGWLGFKKTKAGQIVGWIYNPRNGNGDNYVDFGIRKIYKRAVAGDVSDKMFINGLEASTLLDFNVDGNIMDTAFN